MADLNYVGEKFSTAIYSLAGQWPDATAPALRLPELSSGANF